MGKQVEEKAVEVFGTKEVSIKEFMGSNDKGLMLLSNYDLAKDNLVALKEKHEARVEELVLIEKLSPSELKELNTIRGELREPRYLVQKIEKNNISVFESYKKKDKSNLKDLIDVNKELEDKADAKIKEEDERKKNEKLEEQRLENERVEKIKTKIDLFETKSYGLIATITFLNVEKVGDEINLIANEDFDYEEYDILFENAKARIQIQYDAKFLDVKEKEEQRLRNEELEKANAEAKRLSDLQASRLSEILPYVAFGDSVDLTKLSFLDDDVYEGILSTKKGLFDADLKESQEAQKLLEAKAEEEKEVIYEIRKKRLEDAGMLYSDENGTFWLKEAAEYILLKEDVSDCSPLEFEETFSEFQNIVQAAKEQVEKEKVFEIRKDRLVEIGFYLDNEEEPVFRHPDLCVGIIQGIMLEDIYGAETIGFENILSEAKNDIQKAKNIAEEAEKQKSIDEQLSKDDAERLKKENKARVKRLSEDKKNLSELIKSLEFRNVIPELENEEMQGFLDGIIEGLNNTKAQLLTELEKL